MEWKWPRRTHRDVDTYFAGYERREVTDPATGRKRTEYVYHGDYYIFSVEEAALGRFRRASALRTAAATALFAAAHALGPRGSVLPCIGVPAVLSIIPLVYLWLGLAGLLRAKTPRMTVRAYAFGLGRMENVLWILLLLWAVSGGGELIYLLAKGLWSGTEPLSAGMQLAALGLMVWQQVRQSALLGTCIHKPAAEENKKG